MPLDTRTGGDIIADAGGSDTCQTRKANSMRYVLPILIMIAVTNLGCRRWWTRRSARDAGPETATTQPETPPLSELAPQPTEPKPPVSSTQPSPGPAPKPGATYTLVKDDTFWSVAQAAYGDGSLWTKIKQANPGVDPNDLKVGQVIKIPPK